MDDFLHNLRQRQKKAQTHGNRRHEKTHSKSRSHPSREKAPTSRSSRGGQAEQLKKIAESLESMADNQHLRVALSERITVAQEKQAQATESLSKALTQLIDNVLTIVTYLDAVSTVRQQRTLKPYSLPPNIDELIALTRDEVKAMIRELRDTGLSYEKIANELNDHKIRTISGRGLWQGQTVYRLFLE